MSVKRVMFIRPGETDWNRLNRWQGQVHIPLNEHGRQQAERLAQFIRPLGIQMIYSSDLRRARDTAELLAAALQTQTMFDKRLRERHMGEWQGLTLQDIKAWYPEEYTRLRENPFQYQIQGGESRQQVMTRVRACFTDIMGRSNSETIGIVSHTTAIMTILNDLVPDSNPFDLEFSNISVTTIVQDDDGSWQIAQLNDVSHLEGMPTLTLGGVTEYDM